MKKTGLLIGGIISLILGVLTAALTREILSTLLYFVIAIVCLCFAFKKSKKIKNQKKGGKKK